MSNVNAKHDDNFRKVLLGQTDDAAAETRPILIDPTTGELKVTAVWDADAVDTDTTDFDHILSAADDDVQKALDTLDDGAVKKATTSTDGAIALFDGVSGNTVKDSGKTIVTTLGTGDTTVPTSKAVKDVTDTINGELTTLENKVETAPTELKISTASKGGVLRCIDDAAGDTARTTDGWIEDEKYGWYFENNASAVSGEFDSAVTRTGRLTLKVSATDATGKASASNIKNASTMVEKYKHLIRIKPNTAYRLRCFVKTFNVAANSVFIGIFQYDSSGVIGTEIFSNKLSGTNDWTLLTLSFTSDADAEFLRYYLYLNEAGNVSDAWFDVNSMTLEEVVTDTSFTGKVAEKIRPIFQAVTTTDNIDQSLDPTGAYTNTYALTNAVNEGATHLQTFTPTKKYITQIGVWVVDKGDAVDWTMVVHDASNNILAQRTIAAASLVEGAFNYFDVLNLWSSGALHFHVYASATTGTPTLKANTTDDLETCSYIQRYAKKSEGFTVVANGVKTDIKSDKDGLLHRSIVDIDNAKFSYLGSFDKETAGYDYANWTDPYALANNSINLLSNGLPISATYDNQVFKVNTVYPIDNVTIKCFIAISATRSCKMQYSLDGVNYVDIRTYTDADAQVWRYDNLQVKSSIFFLRFVAVSATACYLMFLGIDADINISSVPSGLLYPLSASSFSESWNSSITLGRSYVYRQAKYTNEYGVVMPSIEVNYATDGTGTVLGYYPLKIDNSQETTPSIKILASSGIAADTVLDADGEYVALSSAADEGVINYQVGTGATCTAITKNTIYLSSNAESSDSTQDPSLQGNFILGVRNQGITDRIKDIGDEIEYVRNGVVKTSKWLPWTPTLTWTTGTPETNVVTKARYKILDGICYFSFYYKADDGKGATALTISLPVPPRDNDSLTALESQQKQNTTWTSPLAYIDDGATTIAFRNLSTCTDGQAVIVMVNGTYEI